MNNEIEQAKTVVREAERELKELIEKRMKLSLEATIGDDESSKELEGTESRIGDVTKRLERAKLAVEQAKLQAEANKREQKVKAIAQLTKMLEDLDKQHGRLTAQVAQQGHPSDELLDSLVTTARQAHALAHELFSITAHPKFCRQWKGEDKILGKHADRRPRNPFAAKAHVEAPWRELVAVVQGY